MIRSPWNAPRSAAAATRGGATLTEVLMSLLIMSIGIVSVITMFPIAVLRSIQATQLTNSRMMTQNTEQAFRTVFRNPLPTAPYRHTDAYEILNYHLNPVIAGATEVANTLPQFRGVWQPNTLYFPGHIVTASRPKGSYVTQPGQWMICRGNPATGLGDYSGSVEPTWQAGVPYPDDLNITPGVTSRTFDGNLTWSAWWDPTPRPPHPTLPPPAVGRRTGGPGAYPSIVPLRDQYIDPTLSTPALTTFYGTLNYVVDPLGWATFADVLNHPGPNSNYLSFFDNSAAATRPSPSDFGYKYFKATGLAQAVATRPTIASVGNANNPFLLRINGGAATIAEAEALATHPDSWAVEVQPITLENATAFGNYGGVRAAQFPIGTDLSAITIGDCRIVLTSLDSAQTYVRDIPNRVDDPIAGPPGIDAAARIIRWQEPLPIGFIPNGPARIERRDRRFTWMATVNRDFEGHSRVTVVTFFKRGFKPEEEHVYNANFGNDGSIPAVLPVPPPAYAVASGDQIRINWSVTGPTAEPDPLIREGNYVFDGRYAAWYRIVAITRPAAGSAIITVDRPVPIAQRTNFSAPASPGRCILMRGIVELFEITL